MHTTLVIQCTESEEINSLELSEGTFQSSSGPHSLYSYQSHYQQPSTPPSYLWPTPKNSNKSKFKLEST